MVCKEEVCLWFKKNEPHRRLELLCCLLNLCLPFELHFIKTCLEDLNKRVDLKDVEAKSNSHQEIESLCNNTLNENVRSKLVICLAFLGASNRTGSEVIYRFLVSSTEGTSYRDANYLKDMLLLYTMVLNHPAFTFQQKNSVGNLFEGLRKLANENDDTPILQDGGEEAELKLQSSSDTEELSTAVDAVQPSVPRPAECSPLTRVPAHLSYFEGMPREYMEHLSQLTGALPYLPHPLHAVPGQQQSSQHTAAVPAEASASLGSYSPSHHFPSLVLDYAAVAAANTYYTPTALHQPQYAIADAVTSPPPPPPPPPPPVAPSVPVEDAPKSGTPFVAAEVPPHEPTGHLPPVPPHPLLAAPSVYREYPDPGMAPLTQERPVAIVALPHQPNNIDHNARRKNPESEEEFLYGDDVSVSTTYIYNSNIVAPALSLAHPSTMSLTGYVGPGSAEGGCLLPCPADRGEPDGGYGIVSGVHQHTSSAHSSAQSSSPYASPPQSLPTSRCGSPVPEQHPHEGPVNGVLDSPSSRACLSPQDSELIANNLACFAYQQSQNLSPRCGAQQEGLSGPHFINNDNTMSECSSFRSQCTQPCAVRLETHGSKCGPAVPCGNASPAPVESRHGVESGASPSKQRTDSSHHQKERDMTKQHASPGSVHLSTTVTATVTTVVAHSSPSAQFSPSRKHVYRASNEARSDRQSSVASPSKQDKVISHSKPRSHFDANSSVNANAAKRPESTRASVEGMSSYDLPGSSCASQLHFMSQGEVPLPASAKCASSAQYPCECQPSVASQADEALSEANSTRGGGRAEVASGHDNASKNSRSQRRPSCDSRVAQSPPRGRASHYSKGSTGQGGTSPAKPTTGPPQHRPPPALDCSRDDQAHQQSPAASLQAGVVDCMEPSRLSHMPGSGHSDHNFAAKSSSQQEDVVPSLAPLHGSHPTTYSTPDSSHSVSTTTSHPAALLPALVPHEASLPPVSIPQPAPHMAGPLSQSTPLMAGVAVSASTSPLSPPGPPPSTSGPSSPHTSSMSHSSLASLPTSLTAVAIPSSTPSSVVSSPGGTSSRCGPPPSSVTLVTSVPSSSSGSGCISFGDVNLSSLDLPGPNEVVELSNGADYLLAKPQFESQNRSSTDCVARQAVNSADKSGPSDASHAKYSCQKPLYRDANSCRPLRILTNNSRGKPLSSRNNNSSSSNNNTGSSNPNSSHNKSNHNGKYRSTAHTSCDDSNAFSFRSVSGLNSRNTKRSVDCSSGGRVHMMSPPLRSGLAEPPLGNDALSCVRASASSSLVHLSDDQRPALLPCPTRGANAPLTNGCMPSSSSAPEMSLPPPEDPSSQYMGRPCILPAPQHLLSRAPHFGPNFLSTPPPSLPFQPGVGLLPAPPPAPPSKIPPMVMSSSPPPLTTSPSKTSTLTTSSTSIVTSSSVSCHHYHRTSPPQHRTSPPHQRTSPPRAPPRAPDHTGASVANGYSTNSSTNNNSNNKTGSGPHGCNNGPPPPPPYGGPSYMQYPHMGGPQPYFLGGPRPPHSMFSSHKMPPPPYYGPPRQGNGGVSGGNSSSSSTCSSHSGQHRSRQSSRKSTHQGSGSTGRGGYWGHQSGGRRGLVPPTGGSTDTSPDSSQYSSPPQTPSPDQENKPAGKRNEEETWDRSSFPAGKGGSQGGGSGGDSTPPLPQVPVLFPPPHGSSVRPRYLHYPLLQYHPSPHMWRYTLPHSRFPSSHLPQQQTQPPHGEKSSRETTPALVHLSQPPPGGEGHPEGANGPSISPPGMNGASYAGPPPNYPMLVNATMMALHSLVPTHPHHAPPPPPTPNPAQSLSNGFPAPHPQPSLPPNFPSIPNMSNSSLHPELFFASYGHSPQHSPYLHPPLLPHISAQAPLIANLPTGAGGSGGAPAFPAASAAASKKPSSCYNCGQLGHRGTECREASIEDMTKRTKVS